MSGATNWVAHPCPAGTLFEQMTAQQFHQHIGPEGRAFFNELAEAFGDQQGPSKRLYFESAQRVWPVCDGCDCTKGGNRYKQPKCWTDK